MSLNRIHHIRAAKIFGICIAWMALALAALAQSMSTTTVQGTVYLANGAPGSGTLQISWPAFNTAANQPVTAGKINTTIAADGFVSVNLTPNLGSSPAGLYYTAIYHMSDGTTSTEYWVVPAAAQANIAQVRSQVMPAAQAVQAVNKAYVDQAIQSVAQGNLTSTGGQLTGPLYLTGDPTQTLQAADKHYVDSSFAQALPASGGAANGPLTATQLGAAYQVDQFAGADFGAKLQACLAAVNGTYGGTCDARNFSGNLGMAANLNISAANTTVMLPCATISTASQIIVTAGTRNVSLRGCALRGASNASGSQGGTVIAYSGSKAAIQVGDSGYASNTLGFHLDNVVVNTTSSTSNGAQAIVIYRTQEVDLESLYLLGNSNQTGMTLDGTGNYTGGTFYDNHISGFQTAVNGIGHQVSNSATTDWLNASMFVRLHVDCPTMNGSPISGTYGVNLQQGDGNTFTGGDVENCGTALHLGANAQNNTITGLRNENSTYQVVADTGSAYNSWMTGGTMFTGKLTDNGTRNSFLDTFHRSFNSLNGDWYGSQQDATLTNHLRLGIGSGNERGLLDRYQTDYGYRWTMGLSDATAGEQFYQVLDELNGVNRISVGQYNNGQASTNNQTVINSAGTGAVVLNGSSNAGTGGVVFGSGGANEATVATIGNSGNAQFNGTLQVGGTAQSTGTMTVRNNADAEVDYYLWPGQTASQKGSFTYKDYNGNSQWYMLKDASNNWALNSATGGLDSFKAYQSTNSGDTYVNASNASGVVRVNYESGSGSAFNIYGGNSGSLYAGFTGASSIKFPGLSASTGHNCLQIDSAGFITNTGAACAAAGGSGTVNSGSAGQIAYYTGNGSAVSGMSAVPVASGGTGATTAAGALATLGGVSLVSTSAQTLAGPINASVNSQINVMSYGAKGDCVTDDTAAFTAAQTAALSYSGLPASLYLPKTSGSCYLINDFVWKGVPLIGQPSGNAGNGTGSYNVQLKSSPGHDVLHVPDPSLTSGIVTFQAGWQIRHVTITVNNSVAPVINNTHRWPGRWTDDGNAVSGSAVFTETSGILTCGDVGQAITIGGAGATATTDTLNGALTSTQRTVTLTTGVASSWPSIFAYIKIDSEIMLVEVQGLTNGTVAFANVQRGQAGTTAATHANGASVTVMGNMTTTIQAVTPCWNSPTAKAFNVVTLAANASTTISSAHTYISVLGLPVTENVGNCAISMDMYDGNTADWIATTAGGSYGKMEDVLFATTNGNVNDSCGIFLQGGNSFYGLTVNNYGFYSQKYGAVLGATPEINPQMQSDGQDYMDWQDGLFNFTWTPWISYNGFNMTWQNVQLAAFAGPQFLVTPAAAYENLNGLHIKNVGFETPYTPTAYGWRVEGSEHVFDSVSLTSSAAGQIGYWDAIASTCNNCGLTNSYLNGYGNTFTTGQTGGILGSSGFNSVAVAMYNANPLSGIPPNYNVSQLPYKGSYNLVGRYTGDAGRAGNAATPYNNDDLIIWPNDISTGARSWAGIVQQDSTSVSGAYMILASGTRYNTFNQFVYGNSNAGSSIVVGTNLPNTGATVNLIAKCPSGTTSFTPLFQVYGGTQVTPTLSCTTSYQTYAFHIAWTGSDVGKPVYLGANSGSNTFYAASWQIVPDATTFNGKTLSGAGTSVATGPATSTANDCVKFADAAGTLADSGTACGTGSGGLSGMTATQVPIAATATTATSSKALAGVGTGIETGPTSGTANQDMACYTDASGTLNDCSASTASGYATLTHLGSTVQLAAGSGGTEVTMKPASTGGFAMLDVWQNPTTDVWGVGIYNQGQSYLWLDRTTSRYPIIIPVGLPALSLGGNASGLTTITQSATDNSTLLATDAFVKANLPLAGTTGSIGGSALTAGSCATGTVSIPGATTSMAVVVSPAGGTSPGTGFVWQGYISSPGTVVVQVCAMLAGTPAATGYNVRVIQ
jgi:hypothetical protein